jgi:hypothetical protein
MPPVAIAQLRATPTVDLMTAARALGEDSSVLDESGGARPGAM